jgi:hypothetical protein
MAAVMRRKRGGRERGKKYLERERDGRSRDLQEI